MRLARRYAKLSGEEIRLDRYAKFRKLGQWEEFLVQGGKWREAREARANVRPCSRLEQVVITLPGMGGCVHSQSMLHGCVCIIQLIMCSLCCAASPSSRACRDYIGQGRTLYLPGESW